MKGKIIGVTFKRRGFSLLLVIMILVSGIVVPGHGSRTAVIAATAPTIKNMKVNTFIKHLVETIDLKVDTSVKTPYIVAAINAGIVKDGEFSNYNEYITRADAAVLLNQADEYLNQDTVDATLLKMVLEKRISDLKKIDSDKQEDVAKVYAKGIITGYTNGNYTQSRKFKGNDKITAGAAMTAIKLVVNKSGRAKLSPDGQLVRTTNLPKNYKKFDYILASFPNKFYEKKFDFELTDQFKAGTLDTKYYAYPIEMKNETFRTWYDEWPLSTEMDKYLYDWQGKVKTYLNYVFNVDYRTVDSKWINGLAGMYAKSNLDMPEVIKERYISKMKKNKVIVKSSIISVEPSTLYKSTDGYYMRAYVRYCITAKNINVEQSTLIYNNDAYLLNLKNGEWRDGIFEITFDTSDPFNGDGSDWTIGYNTMLYDEE